VRRLYDFFIGAPLQYQHEIDHVDLPMM